MGRELKFGESNETQYPCLGLLIAASTHYAGKQGHSSDSLNGLKARPRPHVITSAGQMRSKRFNMHASAY